MKRDICCCIIGRLETILSSPATGPRSLDPGLCLARLPGAGATAILALGRGKHD
jgi:hypothetical protein